MFQRIFKAGQRRRQVREQRVKHAGNRRAEFLSRLVRWPVVVTVLFTAGAIAIALMGRSSVSFAVGQRFDQPSFAKVDFQVVDAQQTAQAKIAARAKVASFYTLNRKAVCFDRIRADLKKLFQVAVDADSFEAYSTAMDALHAPAERGAFDRLKRLAELPGDAGRSEFQTWIDRLPLESQYVARGLLKEKRDPLSVTDFVVLRTPEPDGRVTSREIPYSELVPMESAKALSGAAAEVARSVPYELRSTVETIARNAFRDHPSINYDQERTEEAMRAAEQSTPPVHLSFFKGKPFLQPGILSSSDIELLQAHHAAYQDFLARDVPEARALRRERALQLVGLGCIVGVLAVGLMMYTAFQQPWLLERRRRTIIFSSLILGTLAACQAIDARWPSIPELVLAPCFFTASVLAIAAPRRFAVGAMCVVAVLVAPTIDAELTFLVTLLIGVVAAAGQLREVRSRTKLITAGAGTACVVAIASAAGGLVEADAPRYVLEHASLSAGSAILAAFIVSGVLPFIERLFRIATSLTLLEWRDPTKPLLQLLAREAPGTYTHSLTVGMLADAACEPIGANGLLAQVGALYHDVGKIHKAHYFTENQEVGINRHENLAPTMSLLIILGHVKDGIEMAEEYKLPAVLHPFIAEHHGTTLVRYFHTMASEKQPRIASGKHDREISEAEFRYAGPKPRTKETAVLMICDGVEGAVRSLPEPTPGRIESIVHQVISDRLHDGQFDDCDITLRELHLVEESLVKALCSIYHTRIAYPKSKRSTATTDSALQRMSL